MFGSRKRGSVGQYDSRVYIALVLLGNKSLRSLLESMFCGPEESGVNKKNENRYSGQFFYEPAVLSGYPVETLVKSRKEKSERVIPYFRDKCAFGRVLVF